MMPPLYSDLSQTCILNMSILKNFFTLPVLRPASTVPGSGHCIAMTSVKLDKLKEQKLFLDLSEREVTGQTEAPRIGHTDEKVRGVAAYWGGSLCGSQRRRNEHLHCDRRHWKLSATHSGDPGGTCASSTSRSCPDSHSESRGKVPSCFSWGRGNVAALSHARASVPTRLLRASAFHV